MQALRRFFSLYLRGLWLAPVIPLVALFVGGASVYFSPRRLAVASTALAIFFLLGLLGLLVTSVGNLFKKRWLPALFHLLMIPVCLVLMFAGSCILMFADKDDFADNLTIPTDIEVATPSPSAPMSREAGLILSKKVSSIPWLDRLAMTRPSRPGFPRSSTWPPTTRNF